MSYINYRERAIEHLVRLDNYLIEVSPKDEGIPTEMYFKVEDCKEFYKEDFDMVLDWIIDYCKEKGVK